MTSNIADILVKMYCLGIVQCSDFEGVYFFLCSLEA